MLHSRVLRLELKDGWVLTAQPTSHKRIKGWLLYIDSKHGYYNRQKRMVSKAGFTTITLSKGDIKYRWTRHALFASKFINADDMNLAMQICDPELYKLVRFTKQHLIFYVGNTTPHRMIPSPCGPIQLYEAARHYVDQHWDLAEILMNKLLWRGKLRKSPPDLSLYRPTLVSRINYVMRERYGCDWRMDQGIRSPTNEEFRQDLELVNRVLVLLEKEGFSPTK